MIKSIVKQLADVPSGGYFLLKGQTGKRFIKTAWEFKGDPEKLDTVLVVDLESGEVKRLVQTLSVIETAKM